MGRKLGRSQTVELASLSRSALFALLCLMVAVTWLALIPSVDARQLVLVFLPGTPPEAMLAAAARLDLRPVTGVANWPVLIAATGEAGWQGTAGSTPYLFAIAVDGIVGCAPSTAL